MAKPHEIGGAFRFAVELDGLLVGGFSEVSGVQAETETMEYAEGGLNTHVHILPPPQAAALLGEHWAAREQTYQHLLYIHVGVGLRSSVMVGGKLVYGAVDMEGAIGQMIVQTDGPRLSQGGNYGALEAYASIHALERQAAGQLKLGRESLLNGLCEPDKVQYAQLQQALERRDPLVVELFTQAASYFGVGLANLLNILHPEKVILGGPLIASDPFFFQTCTRIAIQNAYYYPTYQVLFSRGALGEEALVTGAAVMVAQAMTD